MFRYDIKNNATGSVGFSYTADAPMDPQPEWGDPSTYTVVVTDITAQAALDNCRRKRAAEYPPVSDFADAMVHAQMGDSSKLTAYYAACEAVKAKYPKPV